MCIRDRSIGSDRLIRYAIDYTRTTKDIVDSVASRYNLTSEERRATLQKLRLIRKSQRQICGEIRRKSKIGPRDSDRTGLLNWLDDKLESVEGRLSESDDDWIPSYESVWTTRAWRSVILGLDLGLSNFYVFILSIIFFLYGSVLTALWHFSLGMDPFLFALLHLELGLAPYSIPLFLI